MEDLVERPAPSNETTAPDQYGRVLVTGASGLIGSSLTPFLLRRGYEVIRLGRTRPDRDREGWISWDPLEGWIDSKGFDGIGAVVHLAGENIAGIWTGRKKRRILESRIRGTRLLAETLAALENPPRLLLCASGASFYGWKPSGGERTESDGPGIGFLAEVAKAWEEAAEPARRAGIRVVHTRLGMVLTQAGGSLKAMLPAFRLGLAGRIGSGRQYWAWVALDDVLSAFLFLLHADALNGPVNLMAPSPVSQREFAATLSRMLRRPQGPPMPELLVRLLGDMGKEMLLAGPAIVPRRLLDAGFRFTHPDLESALRHILRI